jgi:hypothetical protein
MGDRTVVGRLRPGGVSRWARRDKGSLGSLGSGEGGECKQSRGSRGSRDQRKKERMDGRKISGVVVGVGKMI